jgi:Fic family protein
MTPDAEKVLKCGENPLYLPQNLRNKMKVYIYENEFWPNFTWNDQELIELLGKVRNLQGRIVGKMESLGFNLKQQAELETLETEILRSSEIEGEILNPEQVRSSIARKLGMDISGLIPSDRNVEGMVDMMLDATQNFSQPLIESRYCSFMVCHNPSI